MSLIIKSTEDTGEKDRVLHTENKRYPEILAPAGSKEAFYAAVHQGCDGIYMGGKLFGARAYAANFEQEELLNLIRYAHLHGVKVYYTLNTLVKDIEMKELCRELDFLYTSKVDALILQDLGVYMLLKRSYPDFVIHSSTQMNLHQIEDVKCAVSMGFERVVLSRECSLEDIHTIKQETDIEIETFVHGALCYCYSGLCLMSSFYGERSGNRGKCAQPCRLPYTSQNKTAYLLSPKDQMTLEILPQLIESGIDSFKIEGRMKSAEYVGFTTKLYKSYRDLYMNLRKAGRENEYKVDLNQIEQLNQLYNRGHFTPGYYEQHNSQSMISYDHSKHLGIKVGTVKINKNFTFTFSIPIQKEDLLEIHLNVVTKDGAVWPEFYLEKNAPKGKIVMNQLYTSKQTKVDMRSFDANQTYDVYRIRHQHLNETLLAEELKPYNIPIFIKVKAVVSQNLEISTITVNGVPAELTVMGDIVQSANNRPTTAFDFEKQLGKTKDTSFDFVKILYEIDENVFVSLKAINQLRRELLESIEKMILHEYEHKRKIKKNTLKELSDSHKVRVNIMETIKEKPIKNKVHLLVSTFEQCLGLIRFLEKQTKGSIYSIKRVYIDITDLSANQAIDILCKLIPFRELNKSEVFLALPNVLFESFKENLQKKIKEIDDDKTDDKGNSLSLYDGLLVRTLGELNEGISSHKILAIDHQLNVFNQSGRDFFEQFGNVTSISLSNELNTSGIKDIIKGASADIEIIGYQSAPLMQSANCVYKTTNNRCDYLTQGHLLDLNDRKDIAQKVMCHCQMCYNTIYNGKPTYFLDLWKSEIPDTAVMRLDFTYESIREMEIILDSLNGQSYYFDEKRHTRGHFRRGVK